MLHQPTVEKLHELRLFAMAQGLEEQRQSRQYDTLGFEERLALPVDREAIVRDNHRLQFRLKKAKLRQNATIEDMGYRHPRGLDKATVLALASCQWIRQHQNCHITGPTGVGKSYVACALAHKACSEGFRAFYVRTSRIFEELSMAKADRRYRKLLTAYARLDLLILDDWGLVPLTEEQRRDLLEVLDDRHGLRSTIVASQIPVEKWHTVIGDPSIADAALDRLVHNAYTITKGDSLRKNKKES